MATTNLQLGKTVVVGLDMRSGRRVKDEGGEYIVRRLSDKHNPQSSEVFEVWDYRQEPDREKGKTAILEEVSSERMILRPAPPGKEGELKLVVASYTTEGEWGSLSPRGDPHWSVHLPSLASSVRRLAGGKVLAIVGDAHPLIVCQGHMEVEYGLSRVLLEKSSKPVGQFVPVVRFPSDAPTGDVSSQAKLQGLRMFSGNEGSGVYPEPCDGGWRVPQHLHEGCLHLAGAEAGGQFNADFGCSIVIADKSGCRLRPFQLGDPDYEVQCGTHVWFSQPELISVMVIVDRGKENCVICRRQIELSGEEGIRIRTTELWRGKPFELPGKVEGLDLRAAVLAATRKARTPRCEDMMFAQGVTPVQYVQAVTPVE